MLVELLPLHPLSMLNHNLVREKVSWRGHHVQSYRQLEFTEFRWHDLEVSNASSNRDKKALFMCVPSAL